jgi:hypothetical protein
MIAALLMTLAAQPLPIEFEYRSRGGLFATVESVRLIQGSSFQYYAPGWVRGYYSSNWEEQQVEPVQDGFRVTFASADRRATGELEFAGTGNEVTGRRKYEWHGDHPVKIEDAIALIWAPAFAAGTVSVDGGPAISLATPPPPGIDRAARRLATGRNWVFESPFARLEIATEGGEAALIDGRGMGIYWAADHELFWIGFQEVDVARGSPAELSFTMRITGPRRQPAHPRRLDLPRTEMPDAFGPFEEPLPVIPQVKSWRPAEGPPVPLRWTEARAPYERELIAELDRRFEAWNVAAPAVGDTRIEAVVGAGPRGPESYAIEIGADAIRIEAQDAAGLRNAIRTLAQMAVPGANGLAVPRGRLEDWPTIGWRGVHMFVGPDALEFQTRLMNELLVPLRFNQAVIECSQTDWDATPGIETRITTSKEDLARLFDAYRAAGIEPTPLIQSFGHMRWLFENGQNRDVMFNPDVPFSIDPRKPRAREILAGIWGEAIELLRPRKVHFGLDEVDMRGWPGDPRLVTELWRLHIPWLAGLAKRHGVEMMLWGDIALAPGEAPDATHGHTPADAQARRHVIPDGAWVGDWHYINDPRPETFTSLELWQREGQRPIAATWYRPDNIYGFFRAAERAGAGVLQTTWAGFESNERHMKSADDQFESYVLAGEYAWSGRDERPHELPYRPEDVLRRWYFEPPRPARRTAGSAFGGTDDRTIGDVRFRLFAPVPLFWPLSHEYAAAPQEVTIPIGARARGIALALDARARGRDKEEIAQLVIRTADGRMRTGMIHFGWHVRTAGEERNPLLAARSDGLCAVRFNFGEHLEVVSVTLRSVAPAIGLRLHGVTVW